MSQPQPAREVDNPKGGSGMEIFPLLEKSITRRYFTALAEDVFLARGREDLSYLTHSLVLDQILMQLYHRYPSSATVPSTARRNM